ncbi:Myb-like DNA-binding domain containing protein [Histomonas meleagridis]|uniref:Myb-like DNA-binding domain containing protein n=1 Tax=Histomonas meleagridis TaxID=135588 RepID=UPI003559F7C2|nr:Myb-like DNA-binding domain containing protein [Histomonas meleagridis]KAH0804309.1 Myb-like DNA-binding domain containing protein [Histomonas meleagridis]
MQSNEQTPKPKRQKRKFTTEEDQQIQEFVNQHGAKQWDLLASTLVDRTPRQCRDRWKHYLSPDVIHANWTIEEDKTLMQLTSLFGKKWATLVKFFPGRTDINIKNHWNKLQRNWKKINSKNENKEIASSELNTEITTGNVEVPPPIPESNNVGISPTLVIPPAQTETKPIIQPMAPQVVQPEAAQTETPIEVQQTTEVGTFTEKA